MKNWPPRRILVFIVIFIILLLASYGVSQSQSLLNSIKSSSAGITPTETRLPQCVPYPLNKHDSGTSTATPYMGMGDKASFITVTPRPITHVIDLSPDSDALSKSVIIIYRCNGAYDQIIIGPGVKFPEDLHLGQGDTVINSYPLALLPIPPEKPTARTTAPIPTNAPTEIPSIQPTIAPYPVPITPSIENSNKSLFTNTPYPSYPGP